MADFDEWDTDGGGTQDYGSAPDQDGGTPAVTGGLLDPRKLLRPK